MLGKIRESIDKSLVSVSVKSGTYLETEKLKAKVGNVKDEIHNLKQELGEAVFAQWKNGGVNPQTIESACAALSRKEQEIARYQEEIDRITVEKAKILGGTAAGGRSSAGGRNDLYLRKGQRAGGQVLQGLRKKAGDGEPGDAPGSAQKAPLPKLRSPDGAGSQVLLRVRPPGVSGIN